MIAAPAVVSYSTRALNAVKRLGLSGGLKLCMDSSDYTSYTGTGTKWLDRSGGGYDFYLGADGSATSTDPAFTGNAGERGAYWAFDGTQYFTYDTTSESWMDACHKANAQFAIAAWIYSGGANGGIVGNRGTSNASHGFAFFLSAGSALQLSVSNGSALVCNQTSSLTVPTSAWSFVSIIVDASVGAGGINYRVNSSTDTDDSTFTSPSSSAATNPLQIGCRGAAGTLPLASGSRLGALWFWQGVARTDAQMSSVRQATRRRFGV